MKTITVAVDNSRADPVFKAIATHRAAVALRDRISDDHLFDAWCGVEHDAVEKIMETQPTSWAGFDAMIEWFRVETGRDQQWLCARNHLIRFLDGLKAATVDLRKANGSPVAQRELTSVVGRAPSSPHPN